MAIEQRIGRIDRIGQSREVFVFNLVTRGTLEEQILHLLDEKISMFELVVGEVGAILGGLEEDRDFADLMLDAWLQATEEGREQALGVLGQRLDEARQRTRAPRRSTTRCSARISKPHEGGMSELREFVVDLMEHRGAVVEAMESGRARGAGAASRCDKPWAGPSWRGSASGPSARAGAIAIGLEGDWLERFDALLGADGRWSARARVSTAGSAAPGDPERVIERALELPNAVWRFRGVTAAVTRWLVL